MNTNTQKLRELVGDPGVDAITAEALARWTQERRWCFWVLPEHRDEHGYLPVVITEGVGGYAPLRGLGGQDRWYWGADYTAALAVAHAANASRGLTEADARAIVQSALFPASPPLSGADVLLYTLSIVRGEQPTAAGEELGLSELAGRDLPPYTVDWLRFHGAWENEGTDVWVLVTPAGIPTGELVGLIAQCTVPDPGMMPGV